MPVYNVIWAEYWDWNAALGAAEPMGECHDLGSGTRDELDGLVEAGWDTAARLGWGDGCVHLTDCQGIRIRRPEFVAAR